MKKKETKLYNLIFPIWVLWMIPLTWIFVLPANFLIDLTVTSLTMKYLKIPDIKEKIKPVITKVWLLGFTADFLGTALMLAGTMLFPDDDTQLGKWWYKHICSPVSYDPFNNIYSILFITICVIITGILIYLFNYKISLKKLDIEDTLKKKISLSLAVFTAPYLFYLPTCWFF